ncbi:hypothetical protein GGR57DRAFT_458588 [Xylariaceae sp. FL1272]|nr:hypothetical protein GGR57DRAFT_458588 [Xylariaceae sp. FL1272]
MAALSQSNERSVDLAALEASPCYFLCNTATNEGQRIGRNANICSADSVFVQSAIGCLACVKLNDDDTQNDPQIARYLEFCQSEGVDIPDTVEATVTVTFDGAASTLSLTTGLREAAVTVGSGDGSGSASASDSDSLSVTSTTSPAATSPISHNNPILNSSISATSSPTSNTPTATDSAATPTVTIVDKTNNGALQSTTAKALTGAAAGVLAITLLMIAWMWIRKARKRKARALLEKQHFSKDLPSPYSPHDNISSVGQSHGKNAKHKHQTTRKCAASTTPCAEAMKTAQGKCENDACPPKSLEAIENVTELMGSDSFPKELVGSPTAAELEDTSPILRRSLLFRGLEVRKD